MPSFIDMTGRVYGRLTVICRAETSDRYIQWTCHCECGNTVNVRGANLRSGNSESCGCLGSEKREARKVKHGLTETPEYRIWRAMKTRCTNPNSKDYINYGARGIRVCQEWMDSFDAFYRHIGPRPEGMTIDRIDNDGNYEPGNVRWADRSTQNRNKRTGRRP